MPEHPAVQTVREAKLAMVAARQAYVDAVHAARAAGIGNRKIADACQYTDAAIRMLIRRTPARP